MKHIFRTISAAALFCAAAACTEQIDNKLVQDTEVNLVETTFYASNDVETRTTYHDRTVSWEETDVINVFSGETWQKTEAVIKTISESKTSAVFSGLAAEGAGAYCAVYPESDGNSFDGTNLAVTVPSEQVGVAGGFASGANVSVAFTDKNTFSFKNIGALIGFRFKTESDALLTESVTFRARKSEEDSTLLCGLSGSVSLTFDENGLPVTGEGSADYVTLKAPDEGFVNGVTYYVAVLPGDYKGFEITYTDTLGRTFVRSNEMDALLARNEILNIGQLSEPYDILPDEITITLLFNNENNLWPFIGDGVVAKEEQTADGESYYYRYGFEFKGEERTEDLEFVISKGNIATANYQFTTVSGVTNKVLFLNANNNNDAWIKLPGIPGRYLKSVSMSHGNTSNKRFRVQVGTTSASEAYYNSPNLKAASSTEPVTETVEFPTSDSTFGNLKTTQKGNSYVMFFNNGKSLRIFDITLVYTKTQP